MLLDPRRTRTNMKLLQLVWIFLLTVCGQTADTKMKVNEDDDAILNCSLGTADITNGKFDWNKDVGPNKKEVFIYSQGRYSGHGRAGQDPQFEDRVFHFPDQLQFGNASIVIRNTKTSDSGTYTCYLASFPPETKSIISLTVGASPRPYITYDKTNDGVLLQCEVLGASPKPVVEWLDSDGNILPADEPQIIERGGNKYDVVLNVTVTKTGFYRCVSTQKEINHQIYSKTHVPEDKPSGAMIGVAVIIGVVLLIVGFVVGRRSKSKHGASATIRSNEENGVHSPLQQDSHNNTNSPSDTSVKT